MQKENKTTDELISSVKKFPVITQLMCIPEYVKIYKGVSCHEYDIEKVELWILTLQLLSAIATKNEEEQDKVKVEMLKNKILEESESQEFREYLSNLPYSQKESIDCIFAYIQDIFMKIFIIDKVQN